MLLGALTREVESSRSPVRQFLNRFTVGLKDVQRSYRQDAPPITVAPVDKRDANPATLGTAADWLLRFLVCPSPDLGHPMRGVAWQVGPKLLDSLIDLAELMHVEPGCWLPYLNAWRSDPEDRIWEASFTERLRPMEGRFRPTDDPVDFGFTGPVTGSSIAPDLLDRGCWALALATELFRAGPVALNGPLGRLVYPVTVDDLLELTPPAAVAQLAEFRAVIKAALLPHLTSRRGRWVLGPTFEGSRLLAGADGDLAAAGLLLELKTSKTFSLALTDVLEVVGYALLDFDDEYHFDALGFFNARYAKLTTWPLRELLAELAGQAVEVRQVRDEFRQLLERHAGAEAGPLGS